MKVFPHIICFFAVMMSTTSFAVKCGPTYCRCKTDNVNKHSCTTDGIKTTCNTYCNNRPH